MSVTTPTNDLALGSDAALEAALAELDLPASSGETPSPAPTRAERATTTASTDAAPPATSTEADPPAPEPATPAARTTYPKAWKGTEDEWQAFRAEQNRATNRERDRAEATAKEKAELADRLTFLEAQLAARDRAYGGILTQAQFDEQQVRERLLASQAEGNEGYWAARTERDRLAAEAATVEAAQQAGQATAAQSAEADAKLTYATHLVGVTEYASQHGVSGLDYAALYSAAFADPDTADDIAETHTPGISAERHERLVKRIYARADAYLRTQIDAAATAKAQAAAPRPDTAAGRQTALGGTAAASGGPVADYSAAGIDRELNDYYTRVGWGKKAAPVHG